MPDFGWIFLPTISYIIFTIAIITDMIKFKDNKLEQFYWIFNCFFFIYIVAHYALSIKNKGFMNFMSSVALIISLYIFISIGRKNKRNI